MRGDGGRGGYTLRLCKYSHLPSLSSTIFITHWWFLPELTIVRMLLNSDFIIPSFLYIYEFHGVTKSWTRLGDWTELDWTYLYYLHLWLFTMTVAFHFLYWFVSMWTLIFIFYSISYSPLLSWFIFDVQIIHIWLVGTVSKYPLYIFWYVLVTLWALS